MEEYWDVTDSSGTPTGQIYRRGAPDWPDGRFHVVVAVCVVRPDGAVLLTKRAARKAFPLSWEFPGGNARAGESSEVAAIRELEEETAVKVPTSSLIRVGRFVEATSLLDLYVTHSPEVRAVVPDPGEVAGYEWLPLDAVQQRLAAGEMADPWYARLETLWRPLVRTCRRGNSFA